MIRAPERTCAMNPSTSASDLGWALDGPNRGGSESQGRSKARGRRPVHASSSTAPLRSVRGSTALTACCMACNIAIGMETGPLLRTNLDHPAVRQRYEQIADRLVAELRRGALNPGMRLPGERDLAERLGVARATVREALGALQVRGLVETRPGAGSFIASDAL